MKAKMVLFLFVMGVILGGCSVKSNKDILLDDTKTIIKYSPYQKMFMDLNSNFTEEDVKKYMGDHRLIGGRSRLGDYFEYHIFLSKDDNKKACQEFVAVRFLKDGQLEGFRYVSPEFEGYVFYYAKGVFLEFNDQNAKDYSGYKYYGAKSLVIMAKNFYGLKDSFQATYILESVIENFKEYTDVIEEAQKELDFIKGEEAKRNSSITN